jgi:N,N'-diacetyllegionaminate synthase
MSIFIIAEAGVNHNGSIDIAKQLIDVAAFSGADAVKFQTFDASRQVTRDAQKADYQKLNSDNEESQFTMLRSLELNESMHLELIEHCSSRNISFLSTAFDIQSIELLVKLGQQCFKIPSGEITNLPYLRNIGQLRKKIILSTGMSTMDEIAAAIEVIEQAGTPRSKMTILHCTSEYPAPMNEVNLLAMKSIRDKFGLAVGYSDHTAGIEVAIAASAMGACVIEKHFTLDRNLPGPDHKASLEPSQLESMVKSIRNIELALGDGVKSLSLSEKKNIKVVRKSLVTTRVIKAGEVFTNENITAKRPGTGISPMLWDEFVGKVARRNYKADELIEL